MASSEPPGVLLLLFVAGQSLRSARAMEAVRAICRQPLEYRVELEIIDVITEPDRAERDKVLATPTLIRQCPGPPRRLVGDLSDTNRVIRLLGLAQETEPAEQEKTRWQNSGE